MIWGDEMAELKTNAANDLINKLLLILMRYGVDAQEAKAVLYSTLHDYDITERCTDLVPYDGDVNEGMIKKFLMVKMVNGCTKRTIEYYSSSLRRGLARIGKNAPDVTADDIRWYIALRIKDGVSATTCNNELRAMSSFFEWMREEEIIRRNPVVKAGKIKHQKTKKYAFTEEDIERMRAKLRTWREKAMFEMLLSTGCRVSELTMIRIDDINEDGSVEILGKGQKYRKVYINARARVAVENYLGERKDENPFLFAKSTMSFKSASNFGPAKTALWYKYPKLVSPDQPTTNSTIEHLIREIGGRADVENAHPHRFRRTCATMALKRGMSLELVSKMLGHENVGTTQIYLDLNDDDLKQAHRKFVT